MRYLTIIAVALLASCSWSWPWQWGRDTGNCMDDNTCDEANPFEEELVGGTWYCYGQAKDRPWDCSQHPDAAKIVAIEPETPAGNTRAEIYFDDSEAAIGESAYGDNGSTLQESTGIFRHPDDTFAVQLIAVQTMQEVDDFTSHHNIADPFIVRIETQGDTWFVVLLGVYDSQPEASEAADNWNSARQPFSKPWVRPTGPLKAAAQRALAAGA